jgi:hypothetical protein
MKVDQLSRLVMTDDVVIVLPASRDINHTIHIDKCWISYTTERR